MAAYDIPADELITHLAENLKKDKKIEAPQWSQFVKTGCHAEKIPKIEIGGISDVHHCYGKLY